ncbi:aspartate--tRNA ligase, mitochondrial [Diutina catenulata]
MLRRGILRRWLVTLPDRDTTIQKFSFPAATTTVADIGPTSENQRVTLHGHLNRKPRTRATKQFAELRDIHGDTIQLVLNEPLATTAEDCVSVTGKIVKKHMSTGNQDQQWEIQVEEYQLLNSSNLDAARLDKLKHQKPSDLPPQFRYLQLRTPQFQRALRIRSRVTQTIREALLSQNFIEVETPLLFKSTPEGAREFLVPTRTPNRFYALPQSPQQYKQLLMASGVHRYFQIARCFRDEDLRADRQPEFTQVDLEMAYINNAQEVQAVVEDMVQAVWKAVKGQLAYRLRPDGFLETVAPGDTRFNSMRYSDALARFGIDKPDLRSSLEFVNLSNWLKSTNPEFPVVEACVLKGAGSLAKSLLMDQNYPSRKPDVIAIKSEHDRVHWFETLEGNAYTSRNASDTMDAMSKLDLQVGDILAISNRADLSYENPTPLGKFRQIAIAEYPNNWRRQVKRSDRIHEDVSPDVCVGSWVVDFPLFNPVEMESKGEYPQYDFTRLTSTHHPFTMPKLADYGHLSSAPLKVRGEHYDLVINGVEVGGGSRRIHDSALQLYVFESILGIRNHEELFGHLLKALSMGCPPHAGLAIGLDRLCAMVIGSTSIRDVIAFPKNQSGIDPVVDTPSTIPLTTLKQYNIQTFGN